MSETIDRAEFEDLKAQIAELKAQIALLKPGLDEAVVATIAAAIAAYVGQRAKVRFIRRIQESDEPWSSHGRATVVAQHRLPSIRGW